MWLSNIVIPQLAKAKQMPIPSYGGWIGSMAEMLTNVLEIELVIVYPSRGLSEVEFIAIEGVSYFAFPLQKSTFKYRGKTQEIFEQLIDTVKPDIIHIWGTEFPHSLAMVNACEQMKILSKTLVSIQGLCSKIAKHYYSDLPRSVVYKATIAEILRKNNIWMQQNKFKKKGSIEKIILSKIMHVDGRTIWDKACVMQQNPELKYYKCRRILRKAFYTSQWDYESCKPRTIFLSQAGYPIKGLHYLIDALSIILKQYPDTKVFIAGRSLASRRTIRSKLDRKTYDEYIRKKINKSGLSAHVFFLGVLGEMEMMKMYLESNVFVLPSSIDNSPNSLAEAMTLGVPCVVSDVGGVKDMIKHSDEGFVYQHNAPYMLAYYICEIFNSNTLAKQLSIQARSRALIDYDREYNKETMINIYDNILEKNSKK